MDWQADGARPGEFMDTLRVDLFADEVYVFTPQGRGQGLPAGATPLDFAYAVHTDVGHRCVGAKVNGRIVPLHYRAAVGRLRRGADLEAGARPVARLAEARARPRGRATRSASGSPSEQREDLEQKGRESLQQALPKSNGLPHQKVSSSPLLAEIIREMGFKKADDFYVAIGGGKVPVGQVVNKVLQRLKTAEVVGPRTQSHADPAAARAAASASSAQYGIVVDGAADPDVLVRMAKCCTPVPGDEITRLHLARAAASPIHRDDCPNVRALLRTPERFTPVSWDGRRRAQSFRVDDRGRSPGTARACSRTSPARSPSTAATSSSTAATCRTRWPATGTSSRSAT